MKLFLLTCTIFAGVFEVQGSVMINELMAGSSDRRLSWSTNGAPYLGSGAAWMTPGYSADAWTSGNLPAGYGFSGLATDLTRTMKASAPSLYLRKQFTATSAQATGTNPLVLQVEYNDGFVACLLYTSPSPRDRTRS